MSDHSASPSTPRALVIGGSLGGLFAGNLLRRLGWDVDIFERSTQDLDSRGGGIVLQPDVVEVFRRTGIDLDAVELGVPSLHRTVFQPNGTIRTKQYPHVPVGARPSRHRRPACWPARRAVWQA